jgi:hypothetical protein
MFTTAIGGSMLRKALITGAAAAIVGLVVGGASLASADGGSSDRQFVLIERQVSQHFVDLGDAGLSVGDHAVFRSVFTTPTGRTQATSTSSARSSARWLSTAMRLPGCTTGRWS